MANPTKYTPGFSYSGFEASNPGRPKPGAQLDNDFAKIEESIGETVDALADVRRSDGALKNGIVTTDALADAAVTEAKLAPAVLAGIAEAEAAADAAASAATTQAGVATTQAGVATTQAGIAAGYAELARVYSLQAGSYFTETDAEMASVVIPDDVTIVSRIPSSASSGQVAVADELSWWKRTTPPTSDPYFTTSGGAIWTQVGYRESAVLSTLQSAIAGAFTDPSYAGVQPFANRAAFLAATIPSPVMRTAFAVDGRAYLVIRDAAGAITQSDGTKWRPDGAATPQHYGASTGATGATNLTAFTACIAAHSDTIVPVGVYTIGGQIRLAGFNKTLRGESQLARATLSFEDNFDGPSILFEPSDPLSTGKVSGNGMANITLGGNASTRAGRWALDIRKQEQFRLSNVRWGGFSYGIRVAGGQFVHLDNFYGFGSGLSAGSHLSDSTHILIQEAATSGADQPNYNTFITNWNISGSSSKNIRDIITLQQADGLYIGPGYAAYGNRSLLRLAGKSGHAITAVFFNSVYFDGVSPATGSENVISVLDNAVVGQQTIAFSNCYLGNTTGDIISAGVNNNLRDLRFSSCRFNASTTGIGTIKGQSSPIDGLRLIMSGCSIGGAPQGLTVDGGQSVQIDAMCEDIDDATGCIKLTGTIRQKRYAVNATNCVAGVSDTATGGMATPSYEWDAAFAGVKNRTVQSSATDATAGALMAVGAFGLGSSAAPQIADLTVALPGGDYSISPAASGTSGGPDVAGWAATLSVARGSSVPGETWMLYRRASAGSFRAWFGYRNAPTGAVTWHEIVTSNSLATSIGSAPRFTGQHAVVAGEAYIAVGTSSSADWKKVTP